MSIIVAALPTGVVDCVTHPLDCAQQAVGGAVSGVVAAGWEGVCQSFADAAVSLLSSFATGFGGFPTLDVRSGAVTRVYGLSLGLAGVVAVLLVLWQAARAALTHDGAPVGHALVGMGRALLAFLVTLTVAGAALLAADEISAFIINTTFGSTDGLRSKLTTVFQASLTSAPTLLMLLALVAILLTLVLWLELLMRNAAVAVLVATSPIAAAGMVGEATKTWWSKTAAATVQLIVLKPVIALVFAVGFTLTGQAKPTDVATLLSGLLVLLLAALAWPAIARFFTFTSVTPGGGAGLAGLIGAGSNLINGGTGAPVGVDPGQFSRAAEKHTMAAHSAAESGMTAGTRAGAGAGASGGGAGAGGGVAAGVLFAAQAGLDTAQRGANSLVGKSEQMAGHAGLDGANPHANPAGYPRHAQPRWVDRSHQDYSPDPGALNGHGDYGDYNGPAPVPPPEAARHRFADPQQPRQSGPARPERDPGDQP